mmetsp:Transcript_15131/g.39861  ORF Transcript_15131/g.39861 Transcript_15131/m.39861 type:complete len:340 (-) Transcript_15131:141-1160(-)
MHTHTHNSAARSSHVPTAARRLLSSRRWRRRTARHLCLCNHRLRRRHRLCKPCAAVECEERAHEQVRRRDIADRYPQRQHRPRDRRDGEAEQPDRCHAARRGEHAALAADFHERRVPRPRKVGSRVRVDDEFGRPRAVREPADGRVCMRLLGEQRVDCIQPELAQAPRDDVDVVVDLGAQVQQLARAALRHHVRVRPERPHGLVHVLCVPARPAHAAGEDRVQQVDVVVLWADGAEGTEQQHVPVVRQVLHRGGQLVAEVGLDHHVVLEHNERAGLLVGAHLPALDVRKEAADHPRRHQHAPEERHVRHDLLGGQRLAHNRIEPLVPDPLGAERRLDTL